MVDPEVLERLAVAVALGAAVGAEREVADQPAGLRTHLSVALGACLFGIVSTLGFHEFLAHRNDTNFQVDVTRVASNVVVGVGFLGAGLVFREHGKVRNLTTAASVWVTSAIGLSCGVGDLSTAAVATAFLVAALVLLRGPRAWLRRVAPRAEIVRLGLADAGAVPLVTAALQGIDGVELRGTGHEKADGRPVLVAHVRVRGAEPLESRLAAVVARDDVRDVEYDDR